MYIRRNLELILKKYINCREILAIVGPRQSGKTTLLKHIQSELEDSVFLNFEDREILGLFEEDIKGFAKKYFSNKHIFIDEFQHSQNGGKLLKYLYDTYSENKIIISGSSAIDLTIKAIKHLVGRVFVFNLYQLNFDEYLNYKDISLWNIYQELKGKINLKEVKIEDINISENLNNQFYRLYHEFIIWGGYPRVILALDDEEKIIILKNIYNTYFLRDIKDTLGLIDDLKLARLIKALALQIGQLVEYNSLSLLSGYDNITLKKYMNILDKTFVCQSLRPFFRNKTKEIVKNPKIYFFDTGLRNYGINDFNIIENRIDKGFLYENAIFTELLKKDINMNFWRTKSKLEIDFILNIDNKIVPLESKSLVNKIKPTKPLISFIEAYNSPVALLLNENLTGRGNYNNTSLHFLPHWLI